jgi:hypothetical protein
MTEVGERLPRQMVEYPRHLSNGCSAVVRKRTSYSSPSCSKTSNPCTCAIPKSRGRTESFLLDPRI